MFCQPNMRTVAWTIEPDAWWELSLWEELFRSHKNLRGVAASFWCLWCCYDSLYELETYSCTDVKKKSVKRKIKQTSKQKILFLCSSECNVQFQPIKEFKLVRKKIWKNKNGFNVCFQNKANVPITIIKCGVCLKLPVTSEGRTYLRAISTLKKYFKNLRKLTYSLSWQKLE